MLGRLCGIRIGIGPIFTLGNLLALMSIPLAVAMFFGGLMPGVARRYRLTNRRVLIERQKLNFSGRYVEERGVSLDKFDAIDVVVLPGQEWYPAGDLIFRLGNVETFRLVGVSRPETFRHTCPRSPLVVRRRQEGRGSLAGLRGSGRRRSCGFLWHPWRVSAWDFRCAEL